MHDTQTLPGLSLPSPQEEHAFKVQKAFDVIIRDYGGDVSAYFDRYFAKQKAIRDEEEVRKWAVIQKKLLEMQERLTH